MRFIFSLLGCVFLLFKSCSSHSWVECADWRLDVDIDSDEFLEEYYVNGVFDVHTDCKGYGRNRKSCGTTWDSCGFHWQPWVDGFEDFGEITMCRDSIGSPDNEYSASYDDEYPMAEYTVGERYRLLWPAKNHAGYECNTDQRDNEMQLWVNLNVNPTIDLQPYVDGELLYSQMEEAGYTLVIDWHADYLEANPGTSFNLRGNNEFDGLEVYDNVGIDGLPYQNCPHFCEDMDDAVCYGDFELPNIFPEDGIYTFVWWWEFKSHEKYSHCFEVKVTAGEIVDGDGTVSIDSSEDDVRNGTSSKLNKNSNNEDDAVGAIVWSLITFIIVFLLIALLCIVLKRKDMIVCDDNKIIFQKEPQKAPMVTHSQSGLANIVAVGHGQNSNTSTNALPNTTTASNYDGNRTRPTGARPPRPPPPPPTR